MTENNSFQELIEIGKGILLLLLFHLLAGASVFVLGGIVGAVFGGYIFAGVWIIGYMGFFLLQLLYVLPLTIRLKRQRKIGMMKGIIIGAVITALINGSCYLIMVR
jgi:hypothetical protein